MKINLNGITKDYTLQEVAALKKQGYRFILSKKLGVYVPAPVKIHENGETRDTDVGELVRRRAGGEKFLKAKGQPIYAPTDPQKYTAIMRPIWREDKREKRSFHCIYRGKPCCADRDCESCTHPVYLMKSLERAMEVNDPEIPVLPDVADLNIQGERNRKLYEVIGELDPIDLKILLCTAAGMSERAVATAIGFKSKESVRKRKNKFLPQLQKKLEEYT